jgi:hypothetical protein
LGIYQPEQTAIIKPIKIIINSAGIAIMHPITKLHNRSFDNTKYPFSGIRGSS